jgi:hypothetical protein
VLLELFRRIEWSATSSYGNPTCPACGGAKPGTRISASAQADGHLVAPDACELAGCIKQLELQSRGRPDARADTPLYGHGDPLGLRDKFEVIRADGSKHWIKSARYFVLDVGNDDWARIAARLYANLCRRSFRQLHDDILRECEAIDLNNDSAPATRKCPQCLHRDGVECTHPFEDRIGITEDDG